MKVLVVHNYYSVAGGEDVVFHEELKQLQLLLGSENVWQYTVTNAGITKWGAIKSLVGFHAHGKNIARLIKENQIDIVHLHNFFPLLGSTVFRAAKIAGAKLVLTLHNYRLHCIAGNFYRDQIGVCTRCTKSENLFSGVRYKCYRNSYVQSLLAQLSFWNFKKLGALDSIDRFIVLTQFQKELVIQLGLPKEKIYLKPNMLPTRTIKKEADKTGFLFVGRLDDSKGIELLLKTWLLMPEYFKLTVVGSGVLGEALMAQYQQQNIVFMGELNEAEVGQLMAKAKYTLQTSLLYETFGLTIIESMSVGTPVIGFNIGTRPELIEDGKTGFITEVENLKETLLSAYDFEGYEQLSRNAIEKSKSFSNTVLMQQQLSIYETLLNN